MEEAEEHWRMVGVVLVVLVVHLMQVEEEPEVEGGHSRMGAVVVVVAVGAEPNSWSVILGDESSLVGGEVHSMREPWGVTEEEMKVWMMAGSSLSPVVEGAQYHDWEVVEVRSAGLKMVEGRRICAMAVLDRP